MSTLPSCNTVPGEQTHLLSWKRRDLLHDDHHLHRRRRHNLPFLPSLLLHRLPPFQPSSSSRLERVNGVVNLLGSLKENKSAKGAETTRRVVMVVGGIKGGGLLTLETVGEGRGRGRRGSFEVLLGDLLWEFEKEKKVQR